MQTRLVMFKDTEHLKDYPDYGIDVEGNVYSFKYKRTKKLSPGWKKRDHGYRCVSLTHKNGSRKNFLVHRLVAIAFIPTEDITLEVNHINRNSSDNRLENLEWMSRTENMKHNGVVNGFTLDPFVIAKMKEVHSASIRKGLEVPPAYEFMNSIIESSLEQHISQFGLRKVMNPLPHPDRY